MNRTPYGPARYGMTLLELVIALAIMGLAAALAAPMLSRSSTEDTGVVSVVARARRQAIQHAEPLRVRIARDGAWAVQSQQRGVVVDSGSLSTDGMPMDLLIDALGRCTPTGAMTIDTALDPLTCVVTRKGDPS